MEAGNIFNMIRHSVRDQRLIPWIKFIWEMKGIDEEIHCKLLPTDCIDMILNLGSEMMYETSHNKRVAPPFHVNGLREVHSYIHQEKPIYVFGISFYSFGLFPFVHQSMKRLQQRIISLEELSLSLSQGLERAVIGDNDHDIPIAIEQALLDELAIDGGYIEKSQLIRDFIESNEEVTVQHFCKDRLVNIKTFERMVLFYTGFTPKALRNIRRFQKASNQLVHDQTANLTDISYDNHFTDQAHFTKVFRRYSGAVRHVFQAEKVSVKENVKYFYL